MKEEREDGYRSNQKGALKGDDPLDGKTEFGRKKTWGEQPCWWSGEILTFNEKWKNMSPIWVGSWKKYVRYPTGSRKKRTQRGGCFRSYKKSVWWKGNDLKSRAINQEMIDGWGNDLRSCRVCWQRAWLSGMGVGKRLDQKHLPDGNLKILR